MLVCCGTSSFDQLCYLLMGVIIEVIMAFKTIRSSCRKSILKHWLLLSALFASFYIATPLMFLFLESLFLFLAHQTCNSVIDNLFEWEREDAESVWMSARIPQGTTWIGSRMLGARRDWRTSERIKVGSSNWWGCISSRVKMRSSFLMMVWSADNLHLAQISDLNDGSMIRADMNEMLEDA